jgi:predicted HAD superfamily Cof-like phosphohydrolase
MMNKLARQVLEFHRAFDQPVADSPTIPPDDRVRFRAAFIVEEVFEMLEAIFQKPISLNGEIDGPLDYARAIVTQVIRQQPIDHVDLPLLVDALADIDYVVEGCRLEFGVNGEPIADEVHRSNLAKKGATKTPEGKTLKPPGWTPPDIAGELAKQAPGQWHSLGCLIASEATGCRTAPSSDEMYDELKKRALALPPMTLQQAAEQRLDWAYGNLAIDGKASRSGFKIIATTTVDEGLGWTEEQFDAWAEGKKWDAP